MNSRLHSVALLIVCTATLETGPVRARPLALQIAPPADGRMVQAAQLPPPDLGGGFIEFLLTGRIQPLRAAPGVLPARMPSDASPPPAMEIAPYDGPLKPGEIVLNVTRRKVYRILPDGLMEVYHGRTDVSGLFDGQR